MSEREKLAAITLTSTRRQMIAGFAMTVGSLAAAPGAWGMTQTNQQKTTESQSTGTEALLTYLHQEIEIKATSERIYEALLDSAQFHTVTGMPADIDRQAGGAFSTFGGLIVGRNVELVPNRRIVQAWRPASWDPGIYSIVKFELEKQGSQTKVVLDHTGFPEGNFRHLNSGWYIRYWEPLKRYLA